MGLLTYFHEEHESRHVVSFTFLPTVSDAQNEDILAFMRNFEIINRSIDIEPAHFDELYRDKHLQYLMRESSEIASFRLNVESITLAGYNAKKLEVVEQRLRHYVHS